MKSNYEPFVAPSLANTGPAQIGHIRALDGLRGIAILMVLLLHFYPKWLIIDTYPSITPMIGRIIGPGSYGVQLFFVLSGFLITGVLMDSKGQSGFLFKFYARRTLRIFPLYYAALAAVFIVLPLLVRFDAGAVAIASRQAWLWAYMGNWPSIWSWDDSALFNLNHFWSLCVEEHFYFIWPFLVLLTRPIGLLKLSLTLVGISMLFRLIPVLLTHSIPLIFFWPSLNTFDGLAVGAMVAIALRVPTLTRSLPTDVAYRRLLLGFSAASFVLVMMPRRIHHPFIDVFDETVIAVCFGLVLLGALRLKVSDRFYRPLCSTSLVTFGKYSYGLYVIHGILRPAFEKLFDLRGWPTSHGLPFLWMLLYYALTIGASLGLAVISYHGFEVHFLRLKRYFAYTGSRPSRGQPA